MKKTFIPEEFREKYSKIMGKESDTFFEYCKIKMPKSIWINSLKIKPEILVKELREKEWILEKLFHENAYSLKEVTRPGQSEQFKQGLFNVQEKSSMLPALALDPKKGETVLDATAAPGNKTLQLSCLMNGTGKIVCVEKNVQRFKSLNFNVRKFGMKNVIAKRMDLLEAKRKNIFDKVLLDAPCSSEGLVRKNFDALKEWGFGLVERKAELQKKLLQKSLQLLKVNGELVYSTCSLSPEENEGVISTAIEEGNAELVGVKFSDFKTRDGLKEYNGTKFSEGIEKCVRIYPQDNDSQAFFVAKIRKTST
ncbi:MAG: tRNA methyltransferase [Candidatus Diapherotrites archaeon]|uniref:tRNA methyltransferase n=1 Tax=Candidatus Iainarchaeum sp. TaxID=3101447 RepID=A0A2D6LNY4_9ARCH|nr:tRNA methyltransferase [Candidatus Diapherotrites archaeon]|tara:strand:+ start:3062 stop:3988 length:927 start_codon:yes stop_codon:yes gene_type:complete